MPFSKTGKPGISLVVQWLRLVLSMQKAQVQSLVRELDPTCSIVQPEKKKKKRKNNKSRKPD